MLALSAKSTPGELAIVFNWRAYKPKGAFFHLRGFLQAYKTEGCRNTCWPTCIRAYV